MSRTSNALKTMATSFFGDMLAYVLKFVIRTVFIQTLGVEYLGIDGLFANILSLLSLSELGFGMAISYKLYQPIAEGDLGRIRVLMRLYKTVYRVVGVAIIAIGLCCIPFLPMVINDFDKLDSLGINAALVFCLYLAQTASTYLFFAYKSAIVQVHQKGYKLNLAGYVVTIASCVTQLLVLIVARDFIMYIAVVIAFNILQNFVYAVIAQKMYPEELARTDERVTKDELIDLAKDCASLMLYKTNGAVLKATDNIVLSAMMGLTSVGLYSNYLMLQNALKGICGRVLASLDASVGDLHARERGSEHEVGVFRLVNYFAFVIYGFVSVVLFCVVTPFVSAWVGDSLTLGMAFVVPYCLETYLQGNLQFLTRFRTAMGLFQKAKFRPVASAVINLGVSIFAVSLVGIPGVVIGSLTAHIAAEFWYDALIICKHGFGRVKGIYGRYLAMNVYYLLVTCVAGVAAYAVCGFVPLVGWASVVVDMFVSAAIFIGVCVAATFWTGEFKDALVASRRVVSKIAGKA